MEVRDNAREILNEFSRWLLNVNVQIRSFAIISKQRLFVIELPKEFNPFDPGIRLTSNDLRSYPTQLPEMNNMIFPETHFAVINERYQTVGVQKI